VGAFVFDKIIVAPEYGSIDTRRDMIVKPFSQLWEKPENSKVWNHVPHDGCRENEPDGSFWVTCQKDGDGGPEFRDGNHGAGGDGEEESS